jgi:hypothetical protein
MRHHGVNADRENEQNDGGYKPNLHAVHTWLLWSALGGWGVVRATAAAQR